jgi:hypothetical protein
MAAPLGTARMPVVLVVQQEEQPSQLCAQRFFLYILPTNGRTPLAGRFFLNFTQGFTQKNKLSWL